MLYPLWIPCKLVTCFYIGCFVNSRKYKKKGPLAKREVISCQNVKLTFTQELVPPNENFPYNLTYISMKIFIRKRVIDLKHILKHIFFMLEIFQPFK